MARKPALNRRARVADADGMNQLPTRDDLLRRKAIERDELERPRLRAQAIERDLAAARTQCWELLEEFVARARELGLEPPTWQSSSHGAHTSRITWIEGYPLTTGAIVWAPPHRYGIAERRHVRRPQKQVREVDALSLFVPPAPQEPGHPPSFLEPQTASHGGWPYIDRLEHAASIVTALRGELETTLFALMD